MIWKSIIFIFVYSNLGHVITVNAKILGLRQFLTIESSLKNIKNTFYFMLKSLFVFEIFTIFSGFLVM